MTDRVFPCLALSIGWLLAAAGPLAAADEEKPAPSKKVLVELFTSQACDACPPASELLGELATLGFGPEKIVPINFHVDNHKGPWADPYADPSHTRRQHDYSELKRRSDLEHTPLLMIDGHLALLGPARDKTIAAIQKARKEPPAVDLDLQLDGALTRKTLSLTLSPRSPAVAGRDLLVGVALAEDPVTTKVSKGENAGLTLIEHQVVRRFERRFLKLEPEKPQTLKFVLELPYGGQASRFRVAAFVQDRVDGKIYQADALPWYWSRGSGPAAKKANEPGPIVRRKARPSVSTWTADFPGFDPLMTNPLQSDGSMICPACGSSFLPPLAPIHVKPGQVILAPTVSTC